MPVEKTSSPAESLLVAPKEWPLRVEPSLNVSVSGGPWSVTAERRVA